MEITKNSLQIGLLLVPGILATITIEKLCTNKKWSTFRFVLYSFIISIISYYLASFFNRYVW